MQSRHVSCVIQASPEYVYGVVIDPDNLPTWALGLAHSPVRRDGDDLVADSPMGEVRVRFVGRNEFGVADHDVTLPSGDVVTNPLRVIAHPDGCEVIFTVRQLDSTDAEFARDCGMVADDLARLRELVEGVVGRKATMTVSGS